MERIILNQILESPKLILVLITMILFGAGIVVGVSNMIVYTLSFLILMEVVRAIYEYVTDPTHRVKVRYIVDSGILFGMRELFVGWTLIKTETLLGVIMMGVSIITIGVLIWYRKMVMQITPDYMEGCKTCPNKDKDK